MFTGLVTDVGTVRKAEHRNGLTRFEVESGYPLAQIAMGASIMHSGVSLTVAAALPNGDFQVAIIPHTWEVTTLSALKAGSHVNLEIDMLARYVARMIGADAPEGK